ncbi:hypothetical protein TNCT_485791 [Trichonephila clavata]|uniref:SWIM-type domain-containing protein n=1 Tax=Trichonephila clavata TaxID=2740835 RepID=A0A8X6F3C2_TRICU|nr:hypothetical protein TNCT_485791 [Trichonephila clavata]
MKKRITYQPSVEIRTTSEVITAKCICPAYCKHVFALLHAIVDYVSKELFYASKERLQTWHHPKPAKTISQEASKIFLQGSHQNVNCKIRILTMTNWIFVRFWKRRETPRKLFLTKRSFCQLLYAAENVPKICLHWEWKRHSSITKIIFETWKNY